MVAGLEAGGGDGVHAELIVIGGLGGYKGSVGGQGVVDPGVGDLRETDKDRRLNMETY